MYNLIYNYPRNRELLESYHGYYKTNPSWEPQGGKLKGGKNTITVKGVEYYQPRSFVAIPYHHLNGGSCGCQGGFGLSDVKSATKKLAKFGVSKGLDQIPKATALAGTTLGALAGELVGPEGVPIGAFLGKTAGEELGKLARQKIKEKTGYGVYKDLKKVSKKSKSNPKETKLKGKGLTSKTKRPDPKSEELTIKSKLPPRPTKGKGKPNPWVEKVKAYKDKHGVTYGEAMMILKKK
jgi:hypothetical protein